MKLYNKTVYERSGLNYYWILDNSLEFLESLREKRVDHMETYDFSTLYTALPHGEIKKKFSRLFQKGTQRVPLAVFDGHDDVICIANIG